MKKIFLGVVVFVASLMVGGSVLGSCATGGSDYQLDFAGETFAAWVAKYAPAAELTDDGYYIEWHTRASDWESLEAIDSDSSWIRVAYTGSLLSGDYFTTRDSSLAAWLGLITTTSRFVDDYFYYSSNSKMCTAANLALLDMRAGDSVTLYIPSSLGYNSSIGYNTPYETGTSYTALPIRMDIGLKAINNDPSAVELNALNAWVAENWGMSEQDTLKTGMYMRKIIENPVGDSITADSTVYYYFVSRFLDGQLFDTNIDSVATAEGYYSSDTYYYYSTMSPTDFSQAANRTYSVYPYAILEMQRGETAEVAAISSYGAGNYGDLTSTPQILPYEPMLFTIEVLEEEDSTDDSTEDSTDE